MAEIQTHEEYLEQIKNRSAPTPRPRKATEIQTYEEHLRNPRPINSQQGTPLSQGLSIPSIGITGGFGETPLSDMALSNQLSSPIAKKITERLDKERAIKDQKEKIEEDANKLDEMLFLASSEANNNYEITDPKWVSVQGNAIKSAVKRGLMTPDSAVKNFQQIVNQQSHAREAKTKEQGQELTRQAEINRQAEVAEQNKISREKIEALKEKERIKLNTGTPAINSVSVHTQKALGNISASQEEIQAEISRRRSAGLI